MGNIQMNIMLMVMIGLVLLVCSLIGWIFINFRSQFDKQLDEAARERRKINSELHHIDKKVSDYHIDILKSTATKEQLQIQTTKISDIEEKVSANAIAIAAIDSARGG